MGAVALAGRYGDDLSGRDPAKLVSLCGWAISIAIRAIAITLAIAMIQFSIRRDGTRYGANGPRKRDRSVVRDVR